MVVASQSPRVLLSTVSSDSHTWNLVYLTLLLEEHGYQVHNLGATVPDELLIDTARSQQPDVIVVSSVNGHGFLDGRRVIRALRERPGVSHIPAVIGGKLGIAGAGNEAYSQMLVEAGFDAAFDDQDAAVLLETLPGLVGFSLPAAVAA
jgi:methylaspartate mutase sigma subunit